MAIKNPYTQYAILSASSGFDGYDGFFSKVKKAGRAVKKIGKAAVKTVTVAHTQPFRIAKDIKDKGWKKGMKAIPSRLFVDPVTAGNRLLTATATTIAKPGTLVSRQAKRFEKGQTKFEKWTQKRPLQTTAMAAVAIAGAVAAPAIIAGAPAAASAVGGAISANAGAILAAGAGLAAKALQKGEAPVEEAILSTTGVETPTVTPVDSSGAGRGGLMAPLAGAGAGFLVGGPIGAIVGGVLGALASKKGA